ncbi:site-specific integrase [Actinomadura sp. NPDC048955]|uniref:tyrosine-type recombinase/integrase n=1 Tax=Actinomadura sp. NPDC048955 TaxID=3158228 RepID=UPI003408B14A
MGREGAAPGAASLHLVGGTALLRPEEQVAEAMLEGWRNQQLARNLAFSTIEGRENAVKAFTHYADAFPWAWTPQLVDEWLGDLRAVRHLKQSTLRNYSEAVRSFCSFLTDPAYGWAEECERRFGTHPIQIVHEWNTAVHLQENEADPSKRAFTRDELQAFFDHADDQIHRVRGAGHKGWLRAFRDATLFKTAYAYGLRRREARMLDLVDFGRNPHARQFGEFGVCYVRWGKAMKGSPLKRRSVLTVGPRDGVGGMDWVVDILEQWVEEARAGFAQADSPALWPSERSPRIGFSQINTRFATYRAALGLDAGLDFHSFRRSYVTHLIEDGWDPRFVQEQVGHEHASTTSLYTCVSSDFRIRTLRKAMGDTMNAALATGRTRR